MKKGFMIIELSLVILGFIFLLGVFIKVFQEVSNTEFRYEFIQITKKCDLKCTLGKLIP
jgi:hypothetical protein